MTNYAKLWKQQINIEIGSSCKFGIGIVLIVLGIMSIIWTPYELVMNERLNMRPGLPAFEWWLEPPDATASIYLFNITNGDRFLSGEDSKLFMEEVGPIIYKEVWRHQNVIFNDNGTMSYFVNKTPVYNAEKSKIDLNTTIVVPNIGVLIAASYFWNASIITKFGLNALFKMLDSKPLQKMTVYDFLENNSNGFLDVANSLAPALTPIRNVGIVNLLYRDFSDNVTMFIGSQHGHQLFSLIDKYRGSTNVPGYDDTCNFKITNSSEGILYNQVITKDSVLRYYRRPLCKVIPTYYEKELFKSGLKLYKFTMLKDELNRTYPPEEDCFDSYPSLPNGVSDASKCFFSFPVSASFVYFNHTDENLKARVETKELSNKSVPLPYVYVEPVTGIPLVSSAALQANLNIRPLRGFSKILEKFGDQQIPIFWAHYYNDDIPFKVLCLIHITLALPVVGWILTILLFLIGMFNIWKSVKRKPREREDSIVYEFDSKIIIETEAFLK